ncbi:rhodanese-like domain-containing protein [Bacillus benzoevorans]|uniref:Rhodanese-related sulfurtransferase n=1 Tax=Bacillus benzoevorans TaxID=1456 RepID=A0A7X0HPX0_9BACI|nr:rhodanese-like domain-containing protein [Bacillus benzoevorans]MBB6444624.1 rhodanese-related sulfurtransferase [Bacillus benzoevorans]
MKHLTAEEVQQKLKSGEALNLIDVREEDEVAQGKIPGVVHIPLGMIQSRMGELDKDKEYILVCRSGGRSTFAGNFLESQGFKVTNMDGGMLTWTGEVE